jgi:hypothetical protein
MRLDPSFGKLLWIVNTTLVLTIFFCCRDRNSSPFWKGVMWAAGAAKMGFRWNIGKGTKLDFGRTNGLIFVLLQSSFEKSIQ